MFQELNSPTILKNGSSQKIYKKMLIRNATIKDLDAIAAVEAECFPGTEAATKKDFEERLKFYANYFLLMFDDDKTTDGLRLVAFIDGFVTDEKDLSDEMYQRAELHNEKGKWQMIFGVNTIPSHRKKGLAAELIKKFIQKAKQENRLGLVLTCKDKLLNYYSKFGFKNEGVSEKSQHGGVSWNQMRLIF